MDAGFISPSFVSGLGADGEYVLSREVWALDVGRRKPLVSTVNDLFRKRMGRNMSGNSARSFTALLTLADAMNRAPSLDAEGIRQALLQTDIKGEQLIMPWDGVKFDPKSGQNILGKGIIVQVQRGEYVTVWPWDLSSRPVIWPIPPWENRESTK
jgi:branched-chain amino acid transport system substrate-binding protein